MALLMLRRCIIVGCAILTGVMGISHAAEGADPREIKAVFLLNLTRFVRWPETAFPADDAPLVIGLLQEDPLGSVLIEAAKGETSGKHPIQVRRVRTAAEFGECHLIYIASGGFGNVAQMIGPLRTKPVLLVSDADSFLRLGGHVQLFARNGQTRLRLNVPNFQRAELVPSAQLLRVAELVNN
jgi:hypothetical protein